MALVFICLKFVALRFGRSPLPRISLFGEQLWFCRKRTRVKLVFFHVTDLSLRHFLAFKMGWQIHFKWLSAVLRVFCRPLGVPKTLSIVFRSDWSLPHGGTCTDGVKPRGWSRLWYTLPGVGPPPLQCSGPRPPVVLRMP